MEFRVLGPLELVVDGAPRAVPAGAERAVLTLLLLNAGRVVSAETLVDALWGEELPANAGNALQGRVSRLRRALVEAGLPDTALATRRPGYVLDVDPEAVDALQFAQLVADARRAVKGGAAAEGIRLYRRALALWRGEALAELSGEDWARREASRLDELRLEANEERIELELAAGQHRELVGELERLVTLHPLRERLYGQLMVALYRSGRQADALAVYQRLRETLSEELGLDPSAELRQVEQAVLRQDPSLGAPMVERPTERTNLPPRLTSFIGRARELDQVRSLLVDHRLVTLTGPGGAGKTSLSIEAAAALVDDYADGVWLARLAGVSDAAAIPRAVADALGVPDSVGTAEEQLVRYLRSRRALVLLDNCEHLADACAALAEQLLVTCASVRLLATSREPLAVPGEVQLAVPPLDAPPPSAAAEEIRSYDAVLLFVDRARASVPGFELAETTSAHVAQICRQLDGIPLALELAAARLRTFPVSDVAARLDDRFRLLTAGARTADARQRTLRATVEWSHQLLTEPECVLFRRLSVFRSGWTVSAAEDVCAGHGIDRQEIVDLLGRLVDRSLVIADHGEGARFRMLETLRQYGQERLVEAAEDARMAAAHAAYFTGVAEEGEPHLRGPDQGDWLRWLDEERDNVRVALSWCRTRAATEPDMGLRLVAALGWFWYFASDQEGSHEVATMLAAAVNGAPAARARALQSHAVVARPRSCIVHPSEQCAAAARASLELFSELGDGNRAAMSRTLLAVEGIAGTDVPGALAMLAEAREEFVRVGDRWGEALALFVEMELHCIRGDMDQATAFGDRALGVFRLLGDHWGISAIQYHLGVALHRAGRMREALEVYETALAEGLQVGLANTVQYLLANMAHIEVHLGDLELAERHIAEARVVAQRLGAEPNALAALPVGLLARERGDLPAARDQLSAVATAMSGPDTRDWQAAAETALGFVAQHSDDLDAAEEHHRRAWQAASTAADARSGIGAGALEGLACVAAARGEAKNAAALLGAAARWRVDRGRPATALEQRDIDRCAALARELLDVDAFEAAYASVSADAEQLLV